VCVHVYVLLSCTICSPNEEVINTYNEWYTNTYAYICHVVSYIFAISPQIIRNNNTNIISVRDLITIIIEYTKGVKY
jgi:hypothetical protein